MKFTMKPPVAGTRGKMAEAPVAVGPRFNVAYAPLHSVSLASTSVLEAEFAVVGVSHDGRKGVLSWHSCEFLARRAMAETRKAGGKATVFAAPKGDTSTFDPVVKAIVNGLPWH